MRDAKNCKMARAKSATPELLRTYIRQQGSFGKSVRQLPVKLPNGWPRLRAQLLLWNRHNLRLKSLSTERQTHRQKRITEHITDESKNISLTGTAPTLNAKES